MRHNFVNDIGDYAKYALLRALSANETMPVRLGVVWYLTEHIENNGDGQRRPHLSRDNWEGLDSDLLAKMLAIEATLRRQEDLHVRLIEQSDILPPGTIYFSEPLPDFIGTPTERGAQRSAWFDRAMQAIRDCNLLFLDPDNGLEVNSVNSHSRMAGKYVLTSEMVALLATGAGVILYQHGSRLTWRDQRARVHDQLRSKIDGPPLSLRSVRFSAFGVRAFFCVTTNPEMARVMDVGLNALARRVTTWDKAHYLLFE
jgi:hypothetical protein